MVSNTYDKELDPGKYCRFDIETHEYAEIRIAFKKLDGSIKIMIIPEEELHKFNSDLTRINNESVICKLMYMEKDSEKNMGVNVPANKYCVFMINISETPQTLKATISITRVDDPYKIKSNSCVMWDVGRLIVNSCIRAVQEGAWKYRVDLSYEKTKPGWFDSTVDVKFKWQGAAKDVDSFTDALKQWNKDNGIPIF